MIGLLDRQPEGPGGLIGDEPVPGATADSGLPPEERERQEEPADPTQVALAERTADLQRAQAQVIDFLAERRPPVSPSDLSNTGFDDVSGLELDPANASDECVLSSAP